MTSLRWAVAFVVAMAIGLPLSLLLWPLDWFRRHVVMTIFLSVPSSRFRGIFAVWIAHCLDGHCWRCGAKPPTFNDLRGKGLLP